MGQNGIAAFGSTLFVTNVGTNKIGTYTTTGATVSASFITGLNSPEGIAIADGNLYVVNYGNNTVSKYTTSGSLIAASLIPGLTFPVAIAVVGDTLYVSSTGGDANGHGMIRKYSTSGATINSTLVTGLNSPRGIAVYGDIIFVANVNNGTVGEYTAAGTTVNASLISRLHQPTGLTIVPEPSGALLLLVGLASGILCYAKTSPRPLSRRLLQKKTLHTPVRPRIKTASILAAVAMVIDRRDRRWIAILREVAVVLHWPPGFACRFVATL